jgi:hypothetical protein
MGRFISAVLLAAALVCTSVPLGAYTLQYTDTTATKQIRWATMPINITLSTSLQTPPANIKAGSDVVGAARRALARWEAVSNVRFSVVNSTGDSGAATVDGVNLITASVSGGCSFGSVDQAGKARVRFDPATGNITEADLCLNPSTPFSSDGTANTFDLESTFVHEIGHMLGLEHSGVVGATMQPRQGRMGTYGVSDFFPVRSLSADDIAGIRSIYGPLAGLGSISGVVTGTSGGAVFGAHVFAEDVATGRVSGSNISLPSGAYRIDGLPPGQYRLVVEPLNEPVVSTEIPSAGGAYQGLLGATPPLLTVEAGTFTVSAGGVTGANLSVPVTSPSLNARFIGINAQLSTVPAPLTPGQQTTVYVGGDNLFAVTGVSITSPFITLTSAPQQLTFSLNGAPVQVLAFNVSVSNSAPGGDYSVRLSTGSELAYISGGLTIEPQVNTATTVQFNQAAYTYREGDPANHVTITVTRTGDTSGASTVDFATLPDPSFVSSCAASTGLASERCDFTAVRGTLSFAAGETTKTFIVPITDDSYVESPETFTVALSNALGASPGVNASATVTISDNDTAGEPNPIDNSPFFIRQQYLDFLVREPDAGGLQFYLNILAGCAASDVECNKFTRGALSANFFRSPEFQQKGSFVMYLYMVTLGQRPATVAELNDPSKVERPHYQEFITDLQAISDPTDDKAIVSAKKDALTVAWLQRPEVAQKLGGLSNDQFVRTLESTAGVTLANEGALIAALNGGTMTRAQVLRAVVESPEVNAKFFKQAFVTMEYFGYLRRDPEVCRGSSDPANCGYIFHNSRFQLAADPDFLENTIVRGFIESPEYRSRFGPN